MKTSLLLLIIYIVYLALFSLCALFLFFKDKKMAQKGGGAVRIKEKTLLSVCALGGAIGGFIGRILAHHKTDKKYFSLTIYFSILLEIAVLAVMIYFAFI